MTTTPLRTFHDETCPAIVACIPESLCECGGAETRERERHRAAVRSRAALIEWETSHPMLREATR